ncbi:MAG: V-type ATP synthase subunit I [bacterium]|nr:V-type ATP synthase subunit I [bacterium]
MAVARMTKAQVVIHGAESDEVVREIYNLGLIQAIEVLEQEEPFCLSSFAGKGAQQIGKLDPQLREVTHALDILAQYDESGREIIENFVTLKERVSRDEMLRVRKEFDAPEISRQIQECAAALKHLKEQERWLKDDIALLSTLEPLPFPIQELRSTSLVKNVVGQIRKENVEALLQELERREDELFWEEIAVEGQFVYFLIMFSNAPAAGNGHVQEAVPTILEQHGFDSIDLSSYSLTTADELQRLSQELVGIQERVRNAKEELRGFVRHSVSFKIIEEYLQNEIERCKDLQNFAGTQKVFFVEGWMKQSDKPALERGLHHFQDATEILYEDADEDDAAVPVILENASYIQPFEIITRMFGVPKYNEADPTPMLAPFFFLVVGLCLTDAGYGIMLSLFMMWLMKKYVLDAGTIQLARLLFYGGLSTIVCGALTGGWFGTILDELPTALSFITELKKAFTVLDPMKKPIEFLVLALILGYIQVGYGIFLKMKHRIHKGDLSGALLDEGIWLIFINSLFFWMIFSVTGFGKLLIGQGIIATCQGFAALSGAIRIWMHDRGNSNVVMRLLSGVFSLYDIVGVFSDVLSYSRLLALGLATSVIAMIIDMLALMTSGVPGIGILIGLVIFCFGHVFNLVINTLGAFIHSGRLQFVEFFSKFFEAGGKKYKPFKFKSRYFEITD